MTRWY